MKKKNYSNRKMHKELCAELLKYRSVETQISNAFIHVTNSKAFEMMLDTGILASPIHLLRKNVAVPGGELTKGGLRFIESEGTTSFTTVNNNFWPLHFLMEKYTQKAGRVENPFRHDSAGWSKTDVKTLRIYTWLVQSYLTETDEIIGKNLNVFLILLARHASEIGETEFNSVKSSTIESLDQVLRFLYFILCIGRVKVERVYFDSTDNNPIKYMKRMPQECDTDYFKKMFKSRSYTPDQSKHLQTIIGDHFIVHTTHVEPFEIVREKRSVTSYELLAQNLPSYIQYNDVSLVETLEDRVYLLRGMNFSSIAEQPKSLYNRVKDHLMAILKPSPFPIVLFYNSTNLYYIGGGEWRPNKTNLQIGVDITTVGVLEKDANRLEDMLKADARYHLKVVNVDELVEKGKHLSRYKATNESTVEKELFKRFPLKRKWELL